MGRKIAIFGAGAVGGYTGAHMAKAGEDVTFIDPWPEHVEHMRKRRAPHHACQGVPDVHRAGARAPPHRSAALAKEQPVDIAFVCMKSYDTAWATQLIRQYLAPDGYVVSLQNCMNEETIAGHRRLGQDAGLHRQQYQRRPRRARPCPSRRAAKAAPRTRSIAPAKCTAASPSAPRRSARSRRRHADSAKVTDNLWGERWSKLVANAMANGVSACTGLSGARWRERADPAVPGPARREAIRDRPGAWL